MRVLVDLPPGNLVPGPYAPGRRKVFRLYASASAANDLGGVPQLLARLPQPTVLAGQTHQVGPQQADFREAGAECVAHTF